MCLFLTVFQQIAGSLSGPQFKSFSRNTATATRSSQHTATRSIVQAYAGKHINAGIGEPVREMGTVLKVVAGLAGTLLMVGATSPAMAQEVATIQNFGTKCAGCHLGGGNVLQPGATLFPEDLQRNMADTPESLYQIIYSGKGKMPGFGKECAPRGQCTFGPRLADSEIMDLAEFVLQKSAQRWK